MRKRCYDKNSEKFSNYGGRGIIVWEEWKHPGGGFENFYRYVGPRPSKEHTIDRYPNKHGNYEPGNVRWATPQEQCDNRRKIAAIENFSIEEIQARFNRENNVIFNFA